MIIRRQAAIVTQHIGDGIHSQLSIVRGPRGLGFTECFPGPKTMQWFVHVCAE